MSNPATQAIAPIERPSINYFSTSVEPQAISLEDIAAEVAQQDKTIQSTLQASADKIDDLDAVRIYTIQSETNKKTLGLNFMGAFIGKVRGGIDTLIKQQ